MILIILLFFFSISLTNSPAPFPIKLFLSSWNFSNTYYLFQSLTKLESTELGASFKKAKSIINNDDDDDMRIYEYTVRVLEMDNI